MTLLNSEFVTVNGAVESSPGVQASAGWMEHQPNGAGIQDFYAALKKIARSPLSRKLMEEKGDVVDLDAAPKLIHDLNKDLLDRYGESMFRTTAKFPGGTGTGRWQVSGPGALCTAVTSSAFTVSAGGALPTSTLVYARGFANAANNGLFVLAASSTNSSIKTVATLVAEASPPAGATLEVVGIQGASADITVTATQILSTALDFTTLGLQQYAWGWLGGGTAAAPGALGFATAADRGFFRITAIAAHAITVDRTTQAWTTDAGTGKTIQIFFGPWFRNVAGDSGDFKTPSHTLELVAPNIGPAAATDYLYALGCRMGAFVVNAPARGAITAEMSFVASDIPDPTTTRASGASTALPPVATANFNTVSEMRRLRIANAADNTDIFVDVDNWKLSFMPTAKVWKKQGLLAGAGIIDGKYQATLDMAGFLTQDDGWKALRSNITCMFEAALRNNDCGVLFDLPAITIEGGNPGFPAQDAATFAPTAKVFRDPTTNLAAAMTLFPYLPAS